MQPNFRPGKTVTWLLVTGYPARGSATVGRDLDEVLVKFEDELRLLERGPGLHPELAELHHVGDHRDGPRHPVRQQPEGRHPQLAHELLELVRLVEPVGAEDGLVGLGHLEAGHVAVLVHQGLLVSLHARRRRQHWARQPGRRGQVQWSVQCPSTPATYPSPHAHLLLPLTVMVIEVSSAMILMSLGLFLPLLSDEEVFSYFSPVSVGVAMMAESRSSYSIYRNITIIMASTHSSITIFRQHAKSNHSL